MEKRLKNKIDDYMVTFKDNIKEKTSQLGLNKDEGINNLLRFIYDYEKITFNEDDFHKRKRTKNYISICDRCSANRASSEQCTRRKKDGSDYCGTHVKGTPHGIIGDQPQSHPRTHEIEVSVREINGIIYYLDNFNNVYQTEDIVNNIPNPKVFSKYKKQGEQFILYNL
jgi:hypothetical protein